MEKEERLDYAMLISLMTREEAEVMAGALRADGIDAFLGNTNHAGINWFQLVALGGLQVMVSRARLADAKEAVRDRLREHADDHPEDRVRRGDRWKLWVTVIGYLLLGWTAAFLTQYYSEQVYQGYY
jgi:hypothetical protein